MKLFNLEPGARFNVTRRQWLSALGATAGLGTIAWEQPRTGRALEDVLAQPTPSLVTCHVGFRPEARKRVVLRSRQEFDRAKLAVWTDAATKQMVKVQDKPETVFDVHSAPALLNSVTREGMYNVGWENGSVPVVVARDAWLRVLPTLAGYAHHQRCGQSDRANHPVCHLDDGRRRDTGEAVDVTGGWHDAGDLRKWVDATLMNLFGLVALARNLPSFTPTSFPPTSFPPTSPLSRTALLDEIRYGNAFFLKMQDSDGLVWADVGAGIRGDNSDNHWTDNVRSRAGGAGDDRWINVEKRPRIQAMFIAAQAMLHQLFLESDPTYSAACLRAGARCWNAARPDAGSTIDMAWWIMAAVEMSEAQPDPAYCDAVTRLANKLAASQCAHPEHGSDAVRGFFPMWAGNSQPLRDPVHSALPPFALLYAAKSKAGRTSGQSDRWSAASRLYIDEYAQPLAAQSAYAIVPFGLFIDAPSEECYRPLSGRYSFRFFMPVTAHRYSGLNSHLLSHALLFAEAARHLGESGYRDMAYSQLEWVFGTNPFGASLVTGVGHDQPAPFSPFVGPIPGGIMNGICGNQDDQPILNQRGAKDWRTNEYWSPHAGYCQWALSVLESA